MISLTHVTKIFPGSSRPALHQINLSMAKGEWLFVTGPPGSGKSTLLRLLHADMEPSIGTIEVNGRVTTGMPAWRRAHYVRSIGYVPQQQIFGTRKTAYEEVAFALRVIGKSPSVARRIVPEILELVGLGGKEHRYMTELSDGERQRVAIGRAFVNRPLVILADEPTSAMDPDTGIEMMRLLDRINRTGTAVLLSTGDATIVGAMRRRVIELREGSLVSDTAPRVYR